jgi:hypothetical protein
MVEYSIRPRHLTAGLAILLALASPGFTRERGKDPFFQYVAGTENIQDGSRGNLEMGVDGLTFRTHDSSVSVPYSAIKLMQFRPDVSRKVRKAKVPWKVKPPEGGGKKNRYFAILFDDEEPKRPRHAMVLKVSPEAMRPYLAEIDLKSGKRVEVKGYEEYESFR